jgi:hypothetical protein
MVAKALGGRSNNFTGKSLWIVPSSIEPVLGFLSVAFLVLRVLLFGHHDSPIIAYQVAVLLILVYVLRDQVGFEVG